MEFTTKNDRLSKEWDELKDESKPWVEDVIKTESQLPSSYVLRKDFRVATIDLLKSFLTKPKRAMDFPFWAYIILFISTLALFSIIHSLLVFISAETNQYQFKLYVTGTLRIFSATMLALGIALPGVVMLWVITPELTFKSTFKRFLFYYESVVLFSLLGELFFCKFIIDSNMKIQPLIVMGAGAFAVNMLNNALAEEKNIQIKRMFIISILVFSYLQSFLIIDGILPYAINDNIDSPITEFIRAIFSSIFS
jgi:hypothetical protein